MTAESSHAVIFNDGDIGPIIQKISEVTEEVDRDLLLASLIVMLLCTSDPSIALDTSRLQEAVTAVSDHIVWVLDGQATILPRHFPNNSIH